MNMKLKDWIYGIGVVVAIVISVVSLVSVGGNDQQVLGGSTRFPNSDLSAKTITSSGTLSAGATSISSTLDVTGATTITGNLTARGGSYNMATSSATTTLGLFVFGNTGTGISTVGVGSFTQQGCIEMFSATGTPHTLKIVNGALVVVPSTRCN